MCMLGFPKNTIELEKILRTAGAPDGIANQVDAFKKRASVARSESNKGNQYAKGATRSLALRALLSESMKL
jgi:hypothetical protein